MIPQQTSQLPAAWLCVQKDEFSPHLLSVVESFSSQDQAEAFQKKYKHGRVEKDAPELPLSLDEIPIVKPHHLTMRENWLRRNAEFIKPCLGRERKALVFTWEEGISEDMLIFRRGGCAPLLQKTDWPCCENCGEHLTYVGTIDFRDSDARAMVPADAMNYFQCFNFDNCDWFEHGVIEWLRQEDNIVLVQPPVPNQSKTYIGTPWQVHDYDIEDTGYFADDREELMSKFDRGLIGGSPYFSVNIDAVKVGGHPFWIQGDESQHFTCSCEQPMRFLAQFTGYDNIDFVSGTAYIIHCAQNRCEDYGVIIQVF